MAPLDSSDSWLPQIVEALKAGELVALPTETVYGLAGNALCPDTVRKIFEVKGRPFIDPLIVHVHDLEDVDKLAQVPPLLKTLAKHFWPGPLTLILKKREIVPDLVTAGLDTVAIRIPKHPIMRQVLKATNLPLAAPSANPFGYLSPTQASHVTAMLGNKVKHVVDGGPCDIGLESTILDFSDPNNPIVLRPGPISAEIISKAIDIPVRTKELPASESSQAQLAPGLLKHHYSPTTPLFLFPHNSSPEIKNNNHIAVVFNKRPQSQNLKNTFWLSESGDLKEIAHNLFDTLHRLDKQSFHAIYLEKVENSEIGIAINNRLERARHDN